jgi:hypothetical protein
VCNEFEVLLEGGGHSRFCGTDPCFFLKDLRKKTQKILARIGFSELRGGGGDLVVVTSWGVG